MKLQLVILFGGKSLEHDISVLSTQNLLPYFDREKYELTLIGIDREGMWHLSDETCQLNTPEPFYDVWKKVEKRGIDVVFPILHGLNGEDGSIQGFLQIADKPNVGPSTLYAAVGLDKDVMKRLFLQAGLPLLDFYATMSLPEFDYLKERFSLPIFIKPARMGSTLGLSKAMTPEELKKGFALAKKYDQKVIFEPTVEAREFECSVIGLDEPLTSLPAEIEAKTGLYSYLGKYYDRSLTNYIYPAQISEELTHQIQKLALQAYQAVCGEVMGRVDFFFTKEGQLLLNEINTIPGFTYMSMFHRMWEVSGVPTGELIDRLVHFAIERQKCEKNLHHTFMQEELLV